MSNYLHNLVKRSFGLVETAQPRLASLFEPPHASTPLDAGQDSTRATSFNQAVETDERVLPASSATPQRVEAAGMARPATLATSPHTDVPPEPHAQTERMASPDSTAHRPRAQLLDSPHEEAGKPLQVTSEAEPPSERAHTAIVRPSPPAESRTQDSLAQSFATTILPDAPTVAALSHKPPAVDTIRPPARVTLVPPAQVEKHTSHAPTQEQLQAQAVDALEQSMSRPTQRETQTPISKRLVNRAFAAEQSPPAFLEHEPSTIRVTAREKPAALVVQPHVSSHSEESYTDSPQSNRAAPETVVHVTIGRIEVRAAPPQGQAKAAQRSTPAPAQSLEEYLRQRAQGGSGR
jgi:hypothetical protein